MFFPVEPFLNTLKLSKKSIKNDPELIQACGTCSECKACEGQDMSPQKCLNNNELTEEEVIAVALYTGPMFMLYNAALRQAPAHIYNLLKFTKADGSEGTNCFPSTISALVSKSS